MMTLIEAENISRHYGLRSIFRKARSFAAVERVTVRIDAGRTLAVVGESGSGKSTLGRLLLGVDQPSHGALRFDGRNMLSLSASQRQAMTRDLQLVFQNALAALDPRQGISQQIGEPLLIHGLSDGKEAARKALEMMRAVGLGAELATRRPSELSGGQRQRAVIARALITKPRFVVFDESVSALDVSVQAQIISLIRSLRQEEGFASLFISHDLRVVRHVADEVAVMYLGRIVEHGPVQDLFAAPAHPYTRALIAAIPGRQQVDGQKVDRLGGDPPDPANKPAGCAFHTRCPIARTICAQLEPPSISIDRDHYAACHFAGAPLSTQSLASL